MGIHNLWFETNGKTKINIYFENCISTNIKKLLMIALVCERSHFYNEANLNTFELSCEKTSLRVLRADNSHRAKKNNMKYDISIHHIINLFRIYILRY